MHIYLLVVVNIIVEIPENDAELSFRMFVYFFDEILSESVKTFL